MSFELANDEEKNSAEPEMQNDDVNNPNPPNEDSQDNAEVTDESKNNELAEDRYAELKHQIEDMRKHNEYLTYALSQKSESLKNVSTPDPRQQTKKEIESLRSRQSEFISNGQYDEALKISNQIDDLRDSMYAINPAEVAKIAYDASSRAETERAVGEFIASTPWFDPRSSKFDPMMRAAAEALDRQFMNDTIWSAKPPKEAFAEIRRRVEERFGIKNPSQKTNGMPSVGGVNTGSKGGQTNRLPQLSNAEIDFAKKWFPDDPNAVINYAKAKAEMTKRRP